MNWSDQSGSALLLQSLGAEKTAFRAFRIRCLSHLTPKVVEESKSMPQRFEDRGIKITFLASCEEVEEATVAHMRPNSILEVFIENGQRGGSDGVFAACTHLHTTNILMQPKERLGKLIIAPNSSRY